MIIMPFLGPKSLMILCLDPLGKVFETGLGPEKELHCKVQVDCQPD